MRHGNRKVLNVGAGSLIKNAKVSRVGKPPVTVTIHKQFSGDLIGVLTIADAGKRVMHFTTRDVITPGGSQHKHQQAANNSFLHAFGKKWLVQCSKGLLINKDG